MIYVTLLVALGLGALFVWFRVAPVVKGKAVPGETPDERLLKWNSLIVPYVRKQMREGVLVGLGSFFESARDGRPKTMAVWGLLPTLLPDVDFIALAQPGAEATDELSLIHI